MSTPSVRLWATFCRFVNTNNRELTGSRLNRPCCSAEVIVGVVIASSLSMRHQSIVPENGPMSVTMPRLYVLPFSGLRLGFEPLTWKNATSQPGSKPIRMQSWSSVMSPAPCSCAP